MNDARLVDLELKYMVLQKTVEELGDVVARQQRELDRALDALRRMEGRVRDMGHDKFRNRVRYRADGRQWALYITRTRVIYTLPKRWNAATRACRRQVHASRPKRRVCGGACRSRISSVARDVSMSHRHGRYPIRRE